MADFFGFAKGIFNKGMIASVAGWGLAFAVLCFIGILAFFILKDKLKYKTPVTAIIQKENGTFKRIENLRGAVVRSRSGVSDFEIKKPKAFKKKKLGYVPDFSIAGTDDRLTFMIVGDGMVWQQCKEEIVNSKEVEIEVEKDGKVVKQKVNYSLVVEPIPTDIKTITINNIHDAENILEANKLKVTTIAIGAFVLMVFCQILFLFLTSK